MTETSLRLICFHNSTPQLLIGKNRVPLRAERTQNKIMIQCGSSTFRWYFKTPEHLSVPAPMPPPCRIRSCTSQLTRWAVARGHRTNGRDARRARPPSSSTQRSPFHPSGGGSFQCARAPAPPTLATRHPRRVPSSLCRPVFVREGIRWVSCAAEILPCPVARVCQPEPSPLMPRRVRSCSPYR